VGKYNMQYWDGFTNFSEKSVIGNSDIVQKAYKLICFIWR